MATFDAFRPARPAPVSGLLSFLLGRLSVWNDRRVTVRLLTKLTDRELNDIGLTRGDIDDIAARIA